MLSCPSAVTVVTGPKQPTLSNPWAGQKPKSKEQLHLVVNLCYLTDRKLECHNGGEYPYELPENRTYMVPYYEILGYGLPPSDVGNPGDIYVDLTPPCRIYVRKMEAWDWWDWSKQPQWRKRFVMPRHPILSDRFLWKARGGSTSHRLSWLTKRTIKNYSAYDGCIVEAVVEMYQGLCKPSGEEEKRMEAEKTRRLLIAQLSLPTSGKRSRSPSLMCNQLSQLNSSDNITNPDTRPYKKAKLTPNGAGEETEEAEEEIGLDEARHSSSSVRCSGANLNRDDPHDSTVDVPKLSLDRDPDSKADENDVVAESMQGIGIPKDTEGDTEGASDEGNEESAEDDESDEDSESDENEESDEDDESDKDDESDGDDEGEQHRDKATIHISEQLLDPGDVYIKVEDRETPHMRSTPQTDVDPPNAHTDDERQDAIMDGYDIVGVGEDTTLASRARADFTDPCPEDEDTIEAAGSPDALTTRAFALFASVKDLDDARLSAEKKAKTMKIQLDKLMENVENYEVKTLTLEAELKRLRTDNRKLESERKASESAEEKIRTFLEELETYKLRCKYAENLVATHEEQRREMAAKEKENEQKFLELSKQYAEAEAARVVSENALVDVKQMLRKIAV